MNKQLTVSFWHCSLLLFLKQTETKTKEKVTVFTGDWNTAVVKSVVIKLASFYSAGKNKVVWYGISFYRSKSQQMMVPHRPMNIEQLQWEQFCPRVRDAMSVTSMHRRGR